MEFWWVVSWNRSWSVTNALSSISKISNGVGYIILKDLSWTSYLILILTLETQSWQKLITWLNTTSLYGGRKSGNSNFCDVVKFSPFFPFIPKVTIGMPCRTEIEWYPGKSLTLKSQSKKGIKECQAHDHNWNLLQLLQVLQTSPIWWLYWWRYGKFDFIQDSKAIKLGQSWYKEVFLISLMYLLTVWYVQD